MDFVGQLLDVVHGVFIITSFKIQLFNQIHVGRVDYGGQWGSKRFACKGLLTCGSCVAEITAEEKFKLLKDGSYNRHVYYHCTKRKDPNCNEGYLNEVDMQEQIKQYVTTHTTSIKVSYQIQKTMAERQKVSLYHLAKIRYCDPLDPATGCI